MEQQVDKQEYYPVKVTCWDGPFKELREMLFYLKYKELPVGHTCPNCLKEIELDGAHTWDLTKHWRD
jgi:hypothetical protein